MSKVLVFNVPAHGHVNPTLAVVQESAARGEEIIYYLTDEFKQKIQSTGVAFRRYEPVVREQSQSFPSDSFPALSEILSRMFAEGLQFIIPQLLDDVRAEQPDYIIYDSMCLWGKVLGKILQVRAIAFHPSYASNEHFNLLNVFASQNSPASTPNADRMLAIRSNVEQLCTTSEKVKVKGERKSQISFDLFLPQDAVKSQISLWTPLLAATFKTGAFISQSLY